MSLKKIVRFLRSRTRHVTCTVGTLSLLGVSHAYAIGLPTVAPPSSTPSSTTNWIAWVQAYGKDALVLAGLLVMAYGLVQVVGKIMSMYGELSSGRITWGDIGGAAVGGSAILLFGVVLLTAGAAIL